MWFLLEVLDLVSQLFLYLDPVPHLEVPVHDPSRYLVNCQPQVARFLNYPLLWGYLECKNSREPRDSNLMSSRHNLCLNHSFRPDHPPLPNILQRFTQ